MKTAFIRVGRYGLKIMLAALGLAGIFYLLLFTPWGNSLAKSLVEKKLNSVLQTPITIDNFTLTHNAVALNFHDSLHNTVQVDGKFSLITLTLHSFYQADLSHVGELNSFGLPLKTSGSLNGGYGRMMMQGSVNLFDGDLLYRVRLNRFHPSDIHLSIMNIKYQNLMQWLEYPHHSSTVLTGEIDLHGINRRDIQGNVTLRTHTQNFSSSKLIDDNSSFDFFSLFTDDQGKIQPFRLNLTLNASVNELGILEQFAMLPLRGSANLNTTLQGDQDRLVLDAKSNIARSSTHARIHWKKLRPSYIYVDLKHADVPSLFSLFSKKSPTQGILSLNAESNPTAIHYRGNFTSKVTHLNFDNTTTHESMLRDLLKAIP